MKKFYSLLYLTTILFFFSFSAFDCSDAVVITSSACSISNQICAYASSICSVVPLYKSSSFDSSYSSTNEMSSVPMATTELNTDEQLLQIMDSTQLQLLKSDLVGISDMLKKVSENVEAAKEKKNK